MWKSKYEVWVPNLFKVCKICNFWLNCLVKNEEIFVKYFSKNDVPVKIFNILFALLFSTSFRFRNINSLNNLNEWRFVDLTNSQFSFNFNLLALRPVWHYWAIYCTLGNFFKPVATIILPKSPTILGNFCKDVEIFNFASEIIFGQIL